MRFETAAATGQPGEPVDAIGSSVMLYRCLNDSEWTMLEVSGGCRRVTGHPPESIVGNRTQSYADLILPEDRLEVSVEVQEALSQRRPFQITYRIRRADGDVRTVWEQGWGRYDPTGRPTAIEGVITLAP